MATANNAFGCSICDVILLPTERRKVFSSSSEFVLPLLKQVVVDVFGNADKLRDVFLLGSTLCRPCHRRLEAIIKMQKDLEGKLHELMQQVKRLGGRNGMQRELKAVRIRGAPLVESPAGKRSEVWNTPRRMQIRRQVCTPFTSVTPKRVLLNSPATKKTTTYRRFTPVRSMLNRMKPRKQVHKAVSPAIAVSHAVGQN